MPQNSSMSSVEINSEEELELYYNKCGLCPELILPKTALLDYRKTTYHLNDLFLCSTQSTSGWGFRKQQETNVYFLSFTTEGVSEWRMRDSDVVRCSKQLCIVDSSRLIDGQFSPGTITETIMLSSDLLHGEMSVLQGHPCQRRLVFSPSIITGSGAWYAIASVANALRANIGQPFLSSPIAVSHLRQALLSAILERIPHNHTDILRGQKLEVLPGAMRRALDFMLAKADMPISLADVALAAGTSGRNLQLLFKAYRGMSPLAVLRDIRLQRCRENFLHADASRTVSEIALQWGFTNRYLFLRYYAARFGETPNETMSRKRML